MPIQHLLRNAFELQGRFSAIADISALYVHVSQNYIRPGINKMESLSALSDSEYLIQMNEFNNWCTDAAQKIEDLAQTENSSMRRKMERNIQSLRQRLIEAASDYD
jgi:hypothetical protein